MLERIAFEYRKDEPFRVVKDGCVGTIRCMEGGGVSKYIMEIVTYDIPQTVRVRKYDVDTQALCELLREHKAKCGFSNQDIAKKLCQPLTKVEHWFRRDKSFSIPDEEIWPKLKDLLQIQNNDFDLSIMTFEEKDNVYEKSNRLYDSLGLSPTITCADADLLVLDKEKDMEIERLGNIFGEDKGTGYAGNVWNKSKLCPTLQTMQGGYREPMIIDEVKELGFMDNVNTENIINGGEQEHQAIKKDGVCTTLTSSMGTGGGYVPMVVSEQLTETVRIKQATKDGYIECKVGGGGRPQFP